MSSMSRSSLRSAGGGIYESETLRLQKEVDRFTSKLELEKRKLFIIDEQIKQVKSEFDERQDVITKIKPSEFQSKKSNTKFSQAKNSVNIERVALNQTKAKNLQLRKQIDSLRKELTSAQNECKRLNKSINRTKRDATTQHTDYVNGKRLAEETNNQIVALRAKHDEEKEKFENEIKKMQEKLKHKDQVIEFDEKTYDY